MIYRVLKRLAVGPSRNRRIEPGSVICGNRFSAEAIDILLRKGSLSPVSAPPLDAFYGWKLRAARFAEAGYGTMSVLETDDAVLAKAIGSNVRYIKKWKAELREFLGLGGSELGGCGCRGKKPAETTEGLAKEGPRPEAIPEVTEDEGPRPEAALEPGEALESEQEEGNGTTDE